MSHRTDFLDGKLLDLCGPTGRLRAPASYGERAQADELAALGRAVDRSAPTTGYEAWWSRFEDALLETLKTRAWPTVSEIARAAERIRGQQVAAAQADPLGNEPAHLYEMVVEWWLKFRSAGPGSIPKDRHAQRLVNDGHATWGELRRAGFSIPAWAKERAKAERDPNHERILADIHAMGSHLREQQAPQGDLKRLIANTPSVPAEMAAAEDWA